MEIKCRESGGIGHIQIGCGNLKKEMKNKFYNTALSDSGKDPAYFDNDNIDGDDDEGYMNNVTFNSIVKKCSTYEDNEFNNNLNDYTDNKDTDYEKLVKEYELIYSKWFEVADLNKALKRMFRDFNKQTTFNNKKLKTSTTSPTT
jgi:hypothetical protein